ncbi:hypothetical protein Q7W18_09000 [Streptococcus suis]|nr:hypothetical protein [Streptococcus suis]
MSQPIVPLTVPQSRRFEKKSRNDAYSISKSEQTHFLWTILFRVSLARKLESEDGFGCRNFVQEIAYLTFPCTKILFLDARIVSASAFFGCSGRGLTFVEAGQKV